MPREPQTATPLWHDRDPRRPGRGFARRARGALLLGALAFALGCHPIEWFSPGFEAWSPPGGPAVANALAPREPCEHRTALRQPFFGDLHVHTALSMDTTIRGGTSTPDEAYRFARG